MAIQLQGNAGTIAEVDGTTFRALRVTNRPLEYGALGHYRVSINFSCVATQAVNGTIWSMRWGDATRLCIPQYLRIETLQTVAATATIFPTYQVLVARSFTVSDSAGTAVVLTTNNGKKRTSMGTSLVTDMRQTASAAGLTVGTRTLDANPLIDMPTNLTITTPNPITYRKEIDFTNPNEMPLVLAQNEGLIVRGPTTVFGAAGSAFFFIDIAWAEVNAY